jgi:general secretion pathway protein D
MKRFRIAAILAGMSLALVFSSLTCASPILSIMPVTQTVSAGNDLTLDVNISGVADLYAFQLDLSFSPTVLAAASTTEGSFLPSGGATFFIPGTIDNIGGTISATADTLIGPIPGVSGSGTLAELTFTAIAAGTTSIDLSNVTLLDSSFNPISINLDSGTVVVTTNTGVTPEPTSFVLMLSGISVLAHKFLRRS